MTDDFVVPDPEALKPESDMELPSPFGAVPPPLPPEVIESADLESGTSPLPAEVLAAGYPDGEPAAPRAAEFSATPPSGAEPPATPPSFVTALPPPSYPSGPSADTTAAAQAVPKKNNQTLIIVLIVIAILLLLCCCCALPVGLIIVNWDSISYEMEGYLLSLL